MSSAKRGLDIRMREELSVPDTGNPEPSLNGVERARVLLASLDPESSCAILKALDEDTRAILEAAGTGVPQSGVPGIPGSRDAAGLPGHEVSLLLEEFCALMTEAGEESLVPDEPLSGVGLSEPGSMGIGCSDQDVARVLDLARNSDPETLATIIGCMESAAAMTVLSSLPQGIRSEVCRRIVRMDYLNACRTGASPGNRTGTGSNSGTGSNDDTSSDAAPGMRGGKPGSSSSGAEGTKPQSTASPGTETQADSLYSLFPVNSGFSED